MKEHGEGFRPPTKLNRDVDKQFRSIDKGLKKRLKKARKKGEKVKGNMQSPASEDITEKLSKVRKTLGLPEEP